MNQIQIILKAASERAHNNDIPYAGAVTPEEAHTLWHTLTNAILIDIRTAAEWDWVGRVPGAIEIEWNQYPGGTRNPMFLDELKSHCSPENLLLFLCRSGARSDSAARLATAAGFPQCYNIQEGFEGDKDSDHHRGNINGWKKAGLPWVQG